MKSIAIAAIAAVRDSLSPNTPLSVALGELSEWDHGPPTGWRPLPSGVQFAKAGLAGLREVSDWSARWRRLQSLVASESVAPAWVAVAYADAAAACAPTWRDVIAVAADLSCRVFLIDTWGKSSGRLFGDVEAAHLVVESGAEVAVISSAAWVGVAARSATARSAAERRGQAFGTRVIRRTLERRAECRRFSMI